MPDTDSIVIVKRFTYRGDSSEEWSNRYHLDGTTPTDDASWKTLADAVIASEKQCYASTTSVVRAYGYVAGNDHAVSTIDYVALGGTLVTGTCASTSGHAMAGDQAATVRARAGTSSKGKPVYCIKFFHGAFQDGTAGDTVSAVTKTNLAAHGATMIGGTLPGSMKWVAPQGHALSNVQASPWVTTRTLKRRGKRPS